MLVTEMKSVISTQEGMTSCLLDGVARAVNSLLILFLAKFCRQIILQSSVPVGFRHLWLSCCEIPFRGGHRWRMGRLPAWGGPAVSSLSQAEEEVWGVPCAGRGGGRSKDPDLVPSLCLALRGT